MRFLLAVLGAAGAVFCAGLPASAGPATTAGAHFRQRTGNARASAASAGTPQDSPAPSGVTYVLPVPGPARVVAPFDPPRTRYGPGHRGVDLAVTRVTAVRAAAAGTVRFAGSVAGRGVVVIAHADGITTEYEPLQVAMHAGTAVRAGTVLGTVSGRHRTCPVDGCLHWAARRGQTYLDPMSLLGTLGPVRLVPW